MPACVARAGCRRRGCGSRAVLSSTQRASVSAGAAGRCSFTRHGCGRWTAGSQVVGRRLPAAASAATCSPERMSLTSSAVRRRPGTRRTGCRAGRRSRICLPNFAALGATSVGDAPARAAPRRPVAGRPRAPRPAPRPARRSAPAGTRVSASGAEQQAEQPGHADRDADARDTVGRRRWPGCRSGRRSRSSRTARSPTQLGLVDRAGVVVEAAGDLQVGDDQPGRVLAAGLDDRDQLLQALVEQRVARRPARAPRRRTTRPAARDRGQRQARLGLRRRSPRPSRPAARRPAPGRSCRACRRCAAPPSTSVEPEAPVEALADLAVVDLDARPAGSAARDSASAMTSGISAS